MGFRLRINEDGYLVRTALEDEGGVHKKKRIKESRDWWLGKHQLGVTISSLPERYWGKRIRVKIEVIGDDEIINQEILGDENGKNKQDI